MYRSVARSVVCGLVTLVAAAGCGGDDGSDEPSADPRLEEAVRAYSDDFLSGDAEAAYAGLSSRCHGELAEDVYADVVAQTADLYGDEEITSYEDDIDGEVAEVTYEYSEPVINQTDERWVLEDGVWHNDDC